MSLPLPRPVGVESDDEFLTLKAYRDASCVMSDAKGYPCVQDDEYQDNEVHNTQYTARNTIKENLSSQLPEGFELISVNFSETRASYQPRSVTYVFSVRPEFLDEQLKNRIDNLMASENLFIRRSADERKSNFKDMDVRQFLSSIELEGADIVVECEVTAAGSIRVQEVLELLELDETKLASPTKRTRVKWRDV
jgi:hypothetical protein